MKMFMCLLSIIAFGSTSSMSQTKDAEPVVIINHSSPFPATMTKQEIRDIFVGKIKFKEGTRILPANNAHENLVEAFLESYLGIDSIDSIDYRILWIRKVFSSGGEAPKLFQSSNETIEYVAKYPGAISYVWPNDLAEKRKGIKKITIQ
ncbi:MAG: hypothetical protein HYR76_09855 [Ignavibacteria bacterium]|nr:hypothetical protein [Ignavibacteria bacterium]